jgi:hypothetical protein
MYAHSGDKEAWVNLMLRIFDNLDIESGFMIKND